MAAPIRWGILSTANIGKKKVIPAIQKSSNGVVAAVASRNLDKARAFAGELDIPAAYGSYEDLLADSSIDAIYNPLPNHLHAPLSIQCAEAGKATLCEKPLARDAAEAQQIVDAFAQRGILFAEAFMYRFHPRTERVKAMVDAGVIGTLKVIEASFTFDITGREDDIRLQPDMGGGSLMDVGCYCINIMRHITGEEPVRVQAIAQIGERSGVDEMMAGALEFPSGVIAHFDCGFRAPQADRYRIRGTRGQIAVNASFTPGPDDETSIHHRSPKGDETITVAPSDQYQLMVEDFGEALLTGRPPRFAPQDAVQNMAVLDRLYASLNA